MITLENYKKATYPIADKFHDAILDMELDGKAFTIESLDDALWNVIICMENDLENMIAETESRT